MLIKVDTSELFNVAFGLTRFARDKITEARNAVMFGDFCTYQKIREDFDTIRSILSTNTFMEWKFVEEILLAKFPTWVEWGTDAECESMASQTEEEPFFEEDSPTVTFSDGSTIDDSDIPF